MTPWARKKKILIFFIVIFFIAVFIYFLYTSFFKASPTCFDGILNADEQGIDCGGACLEVCSFSAVSPNIFWTRSFEVVPGLYNLVSRINNPNGNLSFESSYKFSYFDSKGFLLGEYFGKTKILPYEKKIIFVPSVFVDQARISQTFFEFIEKPSWQKSERVENNILVLSRDLNENFQEPRLDVLVKNEELFSQEEVEVVAVLKNLDGNVVNVSKTYIDKILSGEEKLVFMTWKKRFEEKITSIEIYFNK